MYVIIPGYQINLIKVHSWGNVIVSNSVKKIKKAIFGSCDALRDSMAILADGNCSLCCADYDGRVVIGNAYKQSLEALMVSRKESEKAWLEGFCLLNIVEYVEAVTLIKLGYLISAIHLWYIMLTYIEGCGVCSLSLVI